MTQINPPFDGSPPCPMCPSEIRSAAALVHNFLVRWPETHAFLRLHDLRAYYGRLPESSNPTVNEFHTVVALLCDATEGMTDDGMKVRWTPEVAKRVAELVPRAEAAMAALDPLTDEHFRDARHSHGLENILSESHITRAIRFLPKCEEHFTVKVVDGNGDLVHSVCGTNLQLHQHFKDQLVADPNFYGKVWCPVCKINAPFSQFAPESK